MSTIKQQHKPLKASKLIKQPYNHTMSYPSIYELKDILFNEQNCIDFLRANRVFYEDWTCGNCDAVMEYYPVGQRFRCTSKGCPSEVPIRRNTFFQSTRLPIHKILHMGYLWLKGDTAKSIKGTTRHSKQTVSDFGQYFRDLVADALDFQDDCIGGPDIIVELDETKTGKRKYNRGHRVEGVWVLGGVERTPERKVFIVSVPDRTARTLLEIIDKHVLPGSTIYTDLWKGYSNLNSLNEYNHLTVNHSKEYINITENEIEDGLVLIEKIHTNTIEGTWSALKKSIPHRARKNALIETHLWEFIWRRKNQAKLWDAFIEALAEIHYD